MRYCTAVALILASAAMLPPLGAAHAEATLQQKLAVKNACEKDFDLVCPGVKPGEGRILACVKANFDKLSAPCQSALITFRQQNS